MVSGKDRSEKFSHAEGGPLDKQGYGFSNYTNMMLRIETQLVDHLHWDLLQDITARDTALL